MIGKNLSGITPADLPQLIADEVQEGDEIEFKVTLPTKDGGRNGWLDGGDSIGDRARNEILEVVCAFANAYGGTLLVGIVRT